jgi:hypothetical protein
MQGFNGPLLHSRNVSVLLLSEPHRAGVFAGLDSEAKNLDFPVTHPPEGAVGF